VMSMTDDGTIQPRGTRTDGRPVLDGKSST